MLPELGTGRRAPLLQLGNDVDGQAFVPGLYRMLAHWPAYLAQVATVLGPRFADPHTLACCRPLAARIDAAAALQRALPRPAAPRAPSRREHAPVIGALRRYRKTSPEMVVFGTVLRAALPAE